MTDPQSATPEADVQACVNCGREIEPDLDSFGHVAAALPGSAEFDEFFANPCPAPEPTDQTRLDVQSLQEHLYELIVDHPMWIDGDGETLEYSPEREARIGDFLDAAVLRITALAARLAVHVSPETAEERERIAQAIESQRPLYRSHQALDALQLAAAIARAGGR